MKRLAMVLALALFSTAGAEAQFFARFTNPQVEVTMTHPPGIPLTLERAAVVPRGGDCAEEFTDAVVELFSRRGVELVDRQNIEAVLAEQDLGASGYVDSNTAVELGKIVGSAALILVHAQRCAEEQHQSRKTFTTLKGNQGVEYFAKTEGFFKGSIRVVDLATARIFAAQTVEGRSVLENKSFLGPPELPSTFDARDGALRDAVGRVSRMFFSWQEQRKLYFFNDDECDLRAAFKLLQINDLSGAERQSAENLETCKAAAVKPKFLARAYYNLGMTKFLGAQYDEGLALLQQAYQMDGGSIIAESIGECRRAKELAEAMAKLEDSAEIGTAVATTGASPVAASSSGKASSPSAAGGGSVAERLRQLEDLRSKGLITETEYEAKRKEILKGI